MKTLINKHQYEHAQMLPIVVIGLIITIAMAALILDGGALMLNRRSAQNAADAGTLAGTKRACLSQSDAKTVAITMDLSSFIAKLLDLEKVISVNLGNCQVSLIK